MHGFVNAQEPQKKIPPRKAVIVNKATLLPNKARSDSRDLNPNRGQCDFTLTPVNSVSNPLSQIIQSLVGSGITISNIQTNLPATSEIYGSFSCGSAANLGMESGLLLTTGVVGNAKGPNFSSATSMDNSLPGSSLLSPLTGGGDGYDASVVSFDIVSNSNTITFQYVFASEEYNEFVNAGYNDVFGFFISGPGITGSQNIAVLPNTTTPVNIDNINNGMNSQYYLDNESQQVADPIRFANIEYDGLTVVLTATATVVPGSTYTLTLAIEDVGDGIYDSGVFIKGGSITSGAPSITCPANQVVSAATGQCNASVTGIDPTVTPQGTAYDYTLSGATTGTGNGTASGQIFNGGTTTVTYKITNAPTVTCSFTVTVNTNVVPAVSIVANPGNTICAGTNVTFTATPTNGGTPSYQWKLNGNNVGTNSNTYQNAGLANGDVVTVVMTSSLACANPTTETSNGITMAITGSIVPSVSIAANPGNTICAGTNVTFTATPTNGGTPAYQWKLNGNNIGTNSNTYQNASLVNGDVITVVMTSSLACANPTTATSNGITMAITGSVVPSVSIAANPGNTICAGTNVSFTATPTNGGTPSYQWKLNGNNVGTNSNTYQNSALVNGDVITVVMTSSLACANPTTATSNGITMVVTPNANAGTVSGVSPLCIGQTSTYTSNGTSGGTWSSSNTSVASVNPTTGLVTALSAGTTNIIYSVSGCNTVIASIMLTVNPNVSAGVVSGATSLSVGATNQYSSTGTPGGTWSSTNGGVATVNASTGLVSAVGAGTTNITYTVNNGCGSPVSAFQILTVTSSSGIIHCGPKNDKILVCHNGTEICIAPAAVLTHLGHGDILGHCPRSNTLATKKQEPEKKLTAIAYPNPYTTILKLNINSPVNGVARIEFYNLSGAKIYEIQQYLAAGKSNVIDVKSLSAFKTGIIYKISIGNIEANGLILRPSE